MRAIPATALTVGVGILAVGALLYGYAAIVGAAYPVARLRRRRSRVDDAALVLLMVPIAVIGMLAALVWTGIVTHAASAAIGRRDVRLASVVVLSLRRTPRVLLVGFLALVAFILALALSPIFVIAGVLGLLATPILARSRFAERRPRVRTLVSARDSARCRGLGLRAHRARDDLGMAGGISAFGQPSVTPRNARADGKSALGLSLVVRCRADPRRDRRESCWLVGLLNLGPNLDLIAQLVALVVVGPLAVRRTRSVLPSAGAGAGDGRGPTSSGLEGAHRGRGRHGDANSVLGHGDTGSGSGRGLDGGGVPHPGGPDRHCADRLSDRRCRYT